MGSTGSGRFSDYSGIISPGKGSGPGGGSGIDRCTQAFSCYLEEVGNSAFYTKHGNVPSPGTALIVVHNGRLFAQDEHGDFVGALPTSYNYIAGCIKTGHKYIGIVAASSDTPFPHIHADFSPA
nr:hypothetical protein [uncultured Methylophaga sp.]